MAQKEKFIKKHSLSPYSLHFNSLDMDDSLLCHHVAHDNTAGVEVSMLFKKAFAERFAILKHRIRDQYNKHMMRFVEHNRWSIRHIVEGVASASAEERGFHGSDLNYEQAKCLADALAHKMIKIIDVYCMRKDNSVIQCDLTYNTGAFSHEELISHEVALWFNKFFYKEEVKVNAIGNLLVHMLAESVKKYMERQLAVTIYTQSISSPEESKMANYEVLNEIKFIINDVVGTPMYYDKESMQQITMVEYIAQAIAGISLTSGSKELPYLKKHLHASDIKKHRRAIIHTIGVMRRLCNDDRYYTKGSSDTKPSSLLDTVVNDKEKEKIITT